MKRVICSECSRELREDEVIAYCFCKDDQKWHTHVDQEVVGFQSGMHNVGPAVTRETGIGYHIESHPIWISRLADGSTSRYAAANDERWREGENVCRDCRDQRVPPAVHGRGQIKAK